MTSWQLLQHQAQQAGTSASRRLQGRCLQAQQPRQQRPCLSVASNWPGLTCSTHFWPAGHRLVSRRHLLMQVRL